MICLIYSTAPDLQTAERIAADLVEARLAACVNIVPGVKSVYRWRGAVERANEVALIVKTGADRAKAAAARLKALHPFKTPAITEIPAGPATDAAFAAWIVDETGEASSS